MWHHAPNIVEMVLNTYNQSEALVFGIVFFKIAGIQIEALLKVSADYRQA